MMTLPRASIFVAPVGIETEAEGPAARMRPLWTTRVPSGISGPEMGRRRAPVKAVGVD